MRDMKKLVTLGLVSVFSTAPFPCRRSFFRSPRRESPYTEGQLLPVSGEIGLALVALAAAVTALVLRARVKELVSRLAAREQRGHFLGESPDLRQILRHAFSATSEVLPVTRFDLYRVGGDGRVEEVWSVSRPEEGAAPEPKLEAGSAHIGE